MKTASLWGWALALAVAGCGGTEDVGGRADGSVSADAAADAGAVDAGPADTGPGDTGGVDAGGCPGTIPYSCIQFCGSDIAPGAECINGAWGCQPGWFPTTEIDTRCVGELTGPCRNGTCESDRICGADDRCWLPCDASLANFTCREAVGTCCGVATSTVTCAPPGAPIGCPAGAIMESDCTGFEPGC